MSREMYVYQTLTPEERAQLVQERLARGYPPHSPPHPVRGQVYYLLTAACKGHAHHMASSTRRQQVLNAQFELLLASGGEVRAWVALPNHYHLLLHLEDFGVLGRVFRLVHARTARQWNLEDDTPGRQVWYCYTDRAIRSEAHYTTRR